MSGQILATPRPRSPFSLMQVKSRALDGLLDKPPLLVGERGSLSQTVNVGGDVGLAHKIEAES